MLRPCYHRLRMREPAVEINFDGQGKLFGQVVFPLEQSWQGRPTLNLPVCVMSNGDGSTVALLAGNHGDEYEGPLVLGRLIRELDRSALQGRLIILPTVNLPAVLAHTRESPLDGKNLNRIWPGDVNGTPTERIVAWLDQEIFTRSQVVMDLHTGGIAMELIPMSMCHYTNDQVRRAEIRAAAVLLIHGRLQTAITGYAMCLPILVFCRSRWGLRSETSTNPLHPQMGA